jgi:2-succinyl-5-enolpyruvyl-6-hydroxy-3-cyclohexene-1-carboxylate synthase
LNVPPNANILWARVLIDALRTGGVRHVCVSPGSRSGPLVLAARESEGLEITVHFDERSAAFFALGLAKATRRPTALVCTSGTAAANYLPAVCEASHACVPMIVLTADRPPELRFAGAPQTMDQRDLYGGFVRSFHEAPLPEMTIDRLRSLRGLALRAVTAACAPPAGPVHIDLPFREPLAPAIEDSETVRSLWASWQKEPRADAPAETENEVDEESIGTIAPRLRAARRPWLVAGPESVAGEEREAVLALSRAWRAPVLADVASGLRFHTGGEPAVCAHADIIARAVGSGATAPDVVLRIGGLPTSKALNETLAACGCETFAVQRDDRRRDPDGIVRTVVRGRTGPVCSRLTREVEGRGVAGSDWIERFVRAERAARSLLETLPIPPEAASVCGAIRAMPGGSTIFLSNSMPVRWAESYAASSDARHEIFVNRGLNGIDGIASTALGAAFGTGAPLLLVTGDLAFLHDLGGLQACRWIEQPVAILLLNNNGGGIFAHLPIGRYPEVSGPLFETPHDCDLEPAARIFGLAHATAATAHEVAAEVAATIASRARRVIEIRTNRGPMALEHAEAIRALVAEVARAWS